MDIIIRDAALSDSRAIYELDRDGMGYDYPEEKTTAQLEKLLKSGRDKILVAEKEGRVVGYVHLNDYDLLYSDHMKKIMGIAVSNHCRRSGVGKMLLEKAEEWAKETGAVGVRLVSGESRKEAHAFYRSLGYEGNKMQVNMKKNF